MVCLFIVDRYQTIWKTV